MIWLLSNCDMVITDSGGLQKEAFFFAKPCITVREETEWVELVENGVNILAGSDKKRILDIYDDGRPRWTNIADLDGLEPESKAAYAISNLIGSGTFERLRQCQDNACDQFFLGPPNALWCSKRCGSRARGRAKRKRDRDAGVLRGT